MVRRKKKIKKELHNETVTPEKLKKVKETIRKNMLHEECNRYIILTLITLFVCGLLVDLVYSNYQRNTQIQQRNIEIRKQNKLLLRKLEESLSQSGFEAHTIDGIRFLRKGMYFNIHENFPLPVLTNQRIAAPIRV